MPERICAVEGCEKPHHAKGYCALHHMRVRRYGAPDLPPPKPWEPRFWAKVDKGDGGCWMWTSSCTAAGYGEFHIGGVKKTIYAHRISWELVHGPIPDGMAVCHHCDNPPCVNPDHLFLGTHTDNMRDMHSKGRAAVGERHTSSRLDAEAVRRIRSSHAEGKAPAEIARGFALGLGVSRAAIYDVINNRTWRSVR